MSHFYFTFSSHRFSFSFSIISYLHATVRAVVPRMDVDREVAAQLTAVDTLLPEICRVAADGCPSFR